MSILCPSCNGSLPSWFVRTSNVESLCPTCYAGLTVEVFPALYRSGETINRAALALGDGEACCYEHASKRAAAVCHRCGRFVCALCEVELQGEVWCPGCLQSNGERAAPQTIETQRTLYDSIALALATWPLLMLYMGFLASPVVIYIAIRYWKRPSSLVPRNKWRFIVALVLAGSELVLLAFIVVAMVFAVRMRRP